MFRLRHQLELDEALRHAPKDVLYGMHQKATRERCSFWYVTCKRQKKRCFGCDSIANSS